MIQPMSRLIHDKFFIVYVIFGGILLTILIIIVMLQFNGRPNATTTQPEPSRQTDSTNQSSRPVASIVVDRVVPDAEFNIASGKSSRFFIYFSEQVDAKDIAAMVTYTYIYEDETMTPLTAQTTLKQLGTNTLELQLIEPVKPGAEYTISIVNKNTNQILSTSTYGSLNTQPTPVANNNPALQQYLPYSAETYSLEYNQQKNLYVFHFINSESSEQPIEEQFKAAKQAAIQFIQSKGIDQNSITVEWKYY